MNDMIAFVLGISSIFFIAFLISLQQYISRIKNIKNSILNNYGKDIDLNKVDLKMDSISSYFRNKNDNLAIDNITWNDLNMDDVFKKINNTQSTVGTEVLYDILRNPIYEESKLIKRNYLIEYLRKNEKERQELQYILGKLGKSNDLYTSSCLFNKLENSNNKFLMYKILSYIPIITLILGFVKNEFFILSIISIIVNIYISQNNKKYNLNTDSFSYIISLISTANKINNLKIKEINENFKKIDEDLNEVKKIKNKYIKSSMNSVMSDLDVFSEYIDMVFLNDLKRYEKIRDVVIRKCENIKAIYEFVGSIDAFIGVASFRESLNYFCNPILRFTEHKDECILEFENIYHPLIKTPVGNSGSFSKGVLVTGSNASGKSTFLKSVAINAVLGQTIYTCCANNYISSYFNIFTSMALKDDVFSNESYYIVEIKSLKRIIDSFENDKPCLCFIDEILRGTNTVERIASSCEVLDYISNNNCLCFAATHDVELTYMLENKFDNYHFEESISDDDIKFDYKLHKGRAQSRNAIKLLKFIGYDENIVLKAEARAERFLETSKW
ncbi:DNA mismatch repair protein MutS [Romboutsia maritimum]|uniref:DNA mismatch repair protein MutS n=1 Tax=Romboutsia maritimum TaxID=2020948 RepID=A0A371IQC1_9FIRM|nr:DNA mismatch repair protein MutS [Romboutsia maritimum]RDY22687.1 DNA mismatch repair protein MutS [Romboutsia maritimum]